MDGRTTLTEQEARYWARTGMLAAFALVLSYAETFIPLPVPVPGAKLGLANIPILMALRLTGFKSALAIAVIKTLVAGMLFGSPVMIPYSAAGTLLALLAMAALVRVPGLHLVLVSVIGAVFHIAGQLAAATLILGTPYVWATFPLLMAIACFTGALTGWVALELVENLSCGATAQEVAEASADALVGASPAPASSPVEAVPVQSTLLARVDARVILLAFAIYLVAVLCASDPLVLAACLALALAAAIAVRVTAHDALMAAVPLLSILVITTIAQVLYNQSGPVAVQLGPVAVTESALFTVGIMFARLVCIMVMSIAFARAVPFARLTEALAKLLGPLRRLGVRVDAFILALDLAVSSISVLSRDFERLKARALERDPAFGRGGLLRKLRSYRQLFAPLAAQAFAYADAVADRFTAEAKGSPAEAGCAA